MSPTPRRYQETLDILDELAAEPDAPTEPTLSVEDLTNLLTGRFLHTDGAIAQMLYDELRPSRAMRDFITFHNEVTLALDGPEAPNEAP